MIFLKKKRKSSARCASLRARLSLASLARLRALRLASQRFSMRFRSVFAAFYPQRNVTFLLGPAAPMGSGDPTAPGIFPIGSILGRARGAIICLSLQSLIRMIFRVVFFFEGG
jgi:hypothetical protein